MMKDGETLKTTEENHENEVAKIKNTLREITNTLNEIEAHIPSINERLLELEKQVKNINTWRHSDWR